MGWFSAQFPTIRYTLNLFLFHKLFHTPTQVTRRFFSMHIRCASIHQTKRQSAPEVVLKNTGIDWMFCIWITRVLFHWKTWDLICFLKGTTEISNRKYAFHFISGPFRQVLIYGFSTLHKLFTMDASPLQGCPGHLTYWHTFSSLSIARYYESVSCPRQLLQSSLLAQTGRSRVCAYWQVFDKFLDP